MRVGAHLTIAKGLPAAAHLARSVGANTFQYFTRNPRGGAVRAMGDEEIGLWLRLREQLDLRPVVGHLPYTVNLAANKPETWDFARRVVREDLVRAARYGAEFFVVHPGSHLGDGVEAGSERIARALADVLESVEAAEAGPAGSSGSKGGTVILLETMAGQGSEVGFRPHQLRHIMELLGWPERVGVCLDSCHLFAAGYDLRTHAGIDEFLAEMDAAVGLERVLAMHLNDSKVPLGARRDRHELLGRGHLGEAGMRALLTHPFIRQLPLLIETPVEDYPQYADEIRRARAYAGASPVLEEDQPAVAAAEATANPPAGKTSMGPAAGGAAARGGSAG